MGAIVPTITSLTSAITAVDTLVNQVQNFGGNTQEDQLRAQQRLALRQLQEQQAAQQRGAQEQGALQREKMQAESAAAEQQRRAALRRAVARQRAAYGAQGIGAGEGSAEAVLLGLFEESDADRMERERIDDIRNRALEQDIAEQKNLNVLQLSQLRERQKLERIAEGY